MGRKKGEANSVVARNSNFEAIEIVGIAEEKAGKKIDFEKIDFEKIDFEKIDFEKMMHLQKGKK